MPLILLLHKLDLSTDEVVNFLSAELSMEPIDLSALSLTPEVLNLVRSGSCPFVRGHSSED